VVNGQKNVVQRVYESAYLYTAKCMSQLTCILLFAVIKWTYIMEMLMALKMGQRRWCEKVMVLGEDSFVSLLQSWQVIMFCYVFIWLGGIKELVFFINLLYLVLSFRFVLVVLFVSLCSTCSSSSWWFWFRKWGFWFMVSPNLRERQAFLCLK